MIDKIEIKNYKGISNLNINFKNFNLLYGRNSIGKTRILSFIADFINFNKSNNLDGKIYFTQLSEENDEKLNKFILDLSIFDNKIQKFKLSSNYDQQKIVKKLDFENLKNSEQLNEFKYSPSKQNFIKFITSLDVNKQFVYSFVKLFIRLDLYLEQAENYAPISYNIDYTNKEIHINEELISNYVNEETLKNTFTEEEKEKYEKIINSLNYFISKIDINFLKISLVFDNIYENELYYLKDVYYHLDTGLKISLRDPILKTNISRGIRHFIKIMEKIINLILNESDILIIDEFDSYIHDDLYNKMISFLIRFVDQNLNKQVITITHNTSSMYFVDKKYIQIIDVNEENDIIAKQIKGSFLNKNSNIEKLYRENIFSQDYINDSDFELLNRK